MKKPALQDVLPYHSIQRIARTGSSIISTARDPSQNDRVVVLKQVSVICITVHACMKEMHMMRLLKQRCAELPIPQVFGWFSTSKYWYIVMEYIEGISLESALRKNGPFPLDDVLFIGRSLAQILRVLHEEEPSIVHADLKPANVIRRNDGRIVLTDFGTARFAQDPPDVFFHGTVGYAAPEQYECQPITPSADIYGLGITLYELLTGQFPESDMPLLKETSTIPNRIREILQSMKRSAPGERPSARNIEQLLY